MAGPQPISTKLAAIWDMDGVIVDTETYHFNAWKRLLHEQGIELTEADFKRTFGMRNEEIIRIFFGQDTTESQIVRLADKKEEYFRELICDRITANLGAIDLIRRLNGSGFLQAIASSAPRQNIQLILDSLEIVEFFETVVSAEDVSVGKPDPQMFLLAAERLNVSPQRCAVIEDSIAGIQAAKSAGMKCIAITSTHPRERLAAADTVINSLEELGASDVRELILQK